MRGVASVGNNITIDRQKWLAPCRDAVARLAWLLPHDVRRSLYRRISPGTAELHDAMQKSEPGLAGETMGLRSAKELGCLFVHIPKNAGTSVGRSLFDNYEGNHLPLGTYQLMFDQHEFESRFKFSFSRNPYDRLLSGYWYGKCGADRIAGAPESPREQRSRKWTAADAVADAESFEQFVLERVTPRNVRLWEHFRPQHRFVCSPSGELSVDFMGRVENFEEDFAKICERLEVETPLLHDRKSFREDRGDPMDQYSPEMRKVVQGVYARDFELFGYERDS